MLRTKKVDMGLGGFAAAGPWQYWLSLSLQESRDRESRPPPHPPPGDMKLPSPGSNAPPGSHVPLGVTLPDGSNAPPGSNASLPPESRFPSPGVTLPPRIRWQWSIFAECGAAQVMTCRPALCCYTHLTSQWGTNTESTADNLVETDVTYDWRSF